MVRIDVRPKCRIFGIAFSFAGNLLRETPERRQRESRSGTNTGRRRLVPDMQCQFRRIVRSEAPVATLIRRHPLLAYYILTFALSWGGFVLVLGPSSLVNTDWQAEGKSLSAVMVMLAGPSIAGLLLTGLVDGRAGYRDLFLRLRKWRVGIRWYALAILPAPIVSAGVLFTLSMTSPLFTADNKAAVVLGGLGAAVTTILEEIGWTGFVVPRLRRRHSVPMTGLIVGVLWGLWHFLQQISVSGTYAGGIPLLAFLMLSVFAAVTNLTAYRVLMVWVYDRTGSLLVTTLMHGMLTASSIFWFTPIATGALFLADVWLVAAVMWLLVGAVAVVDGWLRLGHTKPFRGPDGRVLLNSVAEVKYVRLGEVDQWVMIRGENVANPLLIVLHGGPGMSEMGFFRRFNAPLERYFTVVHWDQRGSGKSFDRNIPQILDDAGSVRRRSRRARRHRARTLREGEGRDPGSLLGLGARRDLRGAISRESLGLRRRRTDWRLGGRRVVVVLLRTRRSVAPARRKGVEEAARDRSAPISGGQERVCRTHGCQSVGWADAPGHSLESRTSAVRPAGIVDLRFATPRARLRVHARRHVGGSLEAESSDTCAGIEDARGHLRRTPRSLGAARDERGLLRCACRAVEETGVVRTLRARSIRRRA